MTLLEMLYFENYNELTLEELDYITSNTNYKMVIHDGVIVGVVRDK